MYYLNLESDKNENKTLVNDKNALFNKVLQDKVCVGANSWKLTFFGFIFRQQEGEVSLGSCTELCEAFSML